MLFSISQVVATDPVDNLTSSDSVDAVPVEESVIELDTEIPSDVIANSADGNVVRGIPTFTDLNNKINSAGNKVELDTDYEYVSSIDGDDLMDGIVIDQDLVIEGNGHTIYGNGARIFLIEEYSTVKINNLTFIGDYEDFEHSYINGGAIYNSGSLSLTNSVFINNYASSNGGAIYNGEDADLNVDGCEFYNNHVIDEDDNSGDGGAIASYGYLYVYDSVFENCTADYGGAIATFKEGKFYNSRFGPEEEGADGNIAYGTGGAIYNHMNEDGGAEPICYAVGCEFYNNGAGAGGGALFNVVAIRSHFGDTNFAVKDSDTGKHYGHNMLLGVNYNCDAEDSDSENYYETIMSTGFTFNAVSLIVDPKDNQFKVKITSKPGGEGIQGLDVYMVVDGGAHIITDLYVDEDEWVYNSTNSEGIVGFPLNGLSEGDHTIEIGLWQSELGRPSQKFTVHLGLVPSSVSGTAISFNEGGSGNTVLTLKGGTVVRQNVYVAGYPAANIQVKGNTITVSNLPAGNYYLSVTTTPDYGYTSSSCTIPIYVNKVAPAPTPKGPTGPKNNKKKVTFKVKKEYGTKHKCSGLFITPKVGGKAVKGLTFKIKIYTKGKVVKTVTIKSVKKVYRYKNCAFYSTNALSKGTHKVKITISTSKYTGSKTTSIVVKKKGTFVNKNGKSKGK